MDEPNETKPAAIVDYAEPKTPRPSSESFGAHAARGGIIMTGMTIAAAVINFATQLGLTHFLLPSDFGVVAVAFSISGVIAVLRDAGAPSILIQRHDEFHDIAGSVFWLTLSGATICAVIVAISAPIVAHYKATPVLLPLLLLTALRFPVGALGTVSNARLMIDLRWAATAGLTLMQTLIAGGLSIAMAWRGFGVYSLVVPLIVADGLRGFGAWLLAQHHAPLRPHWAIIATIAGSSVFIILTNLTMSLRSFGDYLMLSFLRSATETGLYYYAFVMALALARFTLGTAPTVLGPVFSKLKADEARHADFLIRAMHTYAAIGTLPVVMQMVLAWPLFRVFLAANWTPAAPFFAIISLQILLSFVNNVPFQAMWSSGYYKQFFFYSLGFCIYLLVLFYFGARWYGGYGVAWANVAAGVTDLILFPQLAFRLLNVPWRRAMLPLWRPLVAASPAALLAWLLQTNIAPSRQHDLLTVACVGVIGSLAYIVLLRWVWSEVAADLLRLSSRVIGRRGGDAAAAN